MLMEVSLFHKTSRGAAQQNSALKWVQELGRMLRVRFWGFWRLELHQASCEEPFYFFNFGRFYVLK